MKTILVPTDFSACASNAARYAAALALLTNAEVILLHVYHVPPKVIDLADPQSDPEVMEMALYNALHKLAVEIAGSIAEPIQIKTRLSCGFTSEEILRFVKDIPVDLIVMGMHGMSRMEKLFIGSTTSSLIHKSTTPVLALPENYKYKPIRKIVISVDEKPLESPESLNVVQHIAVCSKAKIHLLNVKEAYYSTAEAGIQKNKEILKHFPDLEVHFNTITSRDVEEGIIHYCDENEAEMVVMISHKHGFLDRVIFGTHTRRMAFDTAIPFLCIKDELGHSLHLPDYKNN